MMLKILENLHKDKDLDLPLFPLVFALAFAAGLGGNYDVCFLLDCNSDFQLQHSSGNGTLIGATTNIVGVGLCEHAGYPISFWQFFK